MDVNTPEETSNFVKLIFGGWPTTMRMVTLSRRKDGTVTFNVFGDTSHGDRTFTLSKRDAEKVRDQLNTLLDES